MIDDVTVISDKSAVHNELYISMMADEIGFNQQNCVVQIFFIEIENRYLLNKTTPRVDEKGIYRR